MDQTEENLRNIERIIRNRQTVHVDKIYPAVGDWIITWNDGDWRPQEIAKVYYADNSEKRSIHDLPPPTIVAFMLQNSNMYVLQADGDYKWFGGPLVAKAMFVKLGDVRKTHDWAVDTGIDPSRTTRHNTDIFGL